MGDHEIRTGPSPRSPGVGSRANAREAPKGRAIDSAGGQDAELIKAVADGDGDALAVVYDRHAAAVFSLCLRILRSAEEAEEVLEDVFWQLWQRADRFQPSRGSALAYLLTLARSRAIDRLRTRDRRHRLREERPGSLVDGPPAPPNPFHEALARERQTRLRAALAGLPEPQREAVELSFLEGLSHPEISTRLGTPIGTIKTRIRSGLLRLRDALGDAPEGPEA